MSRVEIKIVATQETDMYTRYHGKSIDKVLPSDFYKDKEASPYYIGLIGGRAADAPPVVFEHTQTVDLPAGKHTIYYEPASTAAEYTWRAEVFVNGVSLGEQTGLWIEKQYVAEFEVKPSMEETIGGFMNMLIPLMMLVMVMSIMSSIIRRVRPR